MEIFWNIPTQGNGHFLGTSIGARALTPGYMQQIAQAADQLGYHGVLVPTLVGTPAQLAAQLLDYAELGIDRFIGVEEAYRFAEQVFPLLPLEPRSMAANAARGPIGEALAGAFYPAPERESAA